MATNPIIKVILMFIILSAATVASLAYAESAGPDSIPSDQVHVSDTPKRETLTADRG